ncbi:hypothetical protein GCM10010052_19110 [Paenarthrobacter histidinolovorans]|nr:hypothetical protein GCM10010052_19110 [Paenarthrobacter histidinolovorans]
MAVAFMDLAAGDCHIHCHVVLRPAMSGYRDACPLSQGFWNEFLHGLTKGRVATPRVFDYHCSVQWVEASHLPSGYRDSADGRSRYLESANRHLNAFQ